MIARRHRKMSATKSGLPSSQIFLFVKPILLAVKNSKINPFLFLNWFASAATRQ